MYIHIYIYIKIFTTLSGKARGDMTWYTKSFSSDCRLTHHWQIISWRCWWGASKFLGTFGIRWTLLDTLCRQTAGLWRSTSEDDFETRRFGPLRLSNDALRRQFFCNRTHSRCLISGMLNTSSKNKNKNSKNKNKNENTKATKNMKNRNKNNNNRKNNNTNNNTNDKGRRRMLTFLVTRW